MDLRVTGAHQLGDLGKRLRAEGEAGKGLRKELFRGINRATKKPKADARAEALSRLPASGGLNQVVAKSRLSTRTRTGGRNVGVSVVAKGTAARSADKGRVRHPVFGNRDAWAWTPVEPGWFTDTMRRAAPLVRREITEAMRTVASRIARD